MPRKIVDAIDIEENHGIYVTFSYGFYTFMALRQVGDASWHLSRVEFTSENRYQPTFVFIGIYSSQEEAKQAVVEQVRTLMAREDEQAHASGQ